MPNVLIRNLDPGVHTALVARATARGLSLQQYLTEELTQLVAKPTLKELFAEIDARPPVEAFPPGAIVAAIHAGRAGR